MPATRSPRRCWPTACGLVGRSFKYHRPRGVLSAGPEEPNALVELRTGARREPNTRATTVELFDGLEATSQNRWPSLKHDLLAVNGLLSPIFVAGFYYKTFMWPASFWEKVYEPAIRRAAGLGKASLEADPDTYEKSWAHCDVLVIGGGPAGLAAALTAARSGARVVLADEDFALRRPAAVGLSDNRRFTRSGLGRPGDCRTARPAQRPPAATDHRFRGLRRRHLRRRRAGQRSPAGSRCHSRRASACGASWRASACWPPARSSGRWSSATTTGPA